MFSHERINGIETSKSFSFHQRKSDEVPHESRELTATALSALLRMKQGKPKPPDATTLRDNTPVFPAKLPSQSFENIWIILLYHVP